jgi:hypothetical protein
VITVPRPLLTARQEELLAKIAQWDREDDDHEFLLAESMGGTHFVGHDDFPVLRADVLQLASKGYVQVEFRGQTLVASVTAEGIDYVESRDEHPNEPASADRLASDRPAISPVDSREFAFVQQGDLRKVLQEDYAESQLALAAGAFKASALLGAGLVEGMLLDALQRPAVVASAGSQAAIARFSGKAGTANWNRAGLRDMIDAAVALGLLDASVGRMADGARDFRDTVHPNAEVRSRSRARKEEAELLLALVKLIYRQLAG